MNNPIDIRITPGTVLFIFAMVVFAWLLFQLKGLIPIVLAALVFAAAIEPAKKLLMRLKIPSPIAVVLVYFLIFYVLSLLIYQLIPILTQQYGIFLESLPRLVDFIISLTQGTQFETIVKNQLEVFSLESAGVSDTFLNIFSSISDNFFSIFNGVINFILIAVLTFLFAVNPDGIKKVFGFVTPYPYREYVLDLWERASYKVGQWLQGQLLLAVIIAILTFFGLVLIGVPSALFLAVFAGLMELIPIFGPVIAAIPALLVAISTGDLTIVLLVFVLFVVIQQIENHFIYPLVVSKVVGVPTTLVILSIVIGSTLGGFLGVILAIPITAALQEFFNDLQQKKISEFVKKEMESNSA